MRTVLYINWHESKDATRRLEFQKCLDINKTIFDEIVNVSDTHVDGVTYAPFHGRPTYNDFFAFMKKDELSVLSNLDIFFDATLLKKIPSAEECFALTRWDVIKEQISFYNHADSQDVWIFTNPPKHIEGADFTLGKAGCLSGNTIIKYNRGERPGTRPIKLSDLYVRFNNKNNMWKHDGTSTYLHSLNIENGTVFYNKINAVIQSGEKETMLISFDDGTNILLTENHPVLMQDKSYKKVSEISVGEKVMAIGSMKAIPTGRKRTFQKRKEIYVKYHPNAHSMKIKNYEYFKTTRAVLVVEAHMNEMSLEEFVFILNSDKEASSKLQFIPKGMDVHHRDDNAMNDELSNLQVLSHKEHAKLHSKHENFHKDFTAIKTIVAMKKNGTEMTYDISMESPHNNFLANGIFVHNCDNAIAHKLALAGYDVKNPSLTIKTYHLHETAYRTYIQGGKVIERVPPPYKLLTPTV